MRVLISRMRTIIGGHHSLRAQIVRGSVGSLAVKAGHTGLSFLASVILARALGAEGLGIYAFALALVSIMAIPMELGLTQLVVRETVRAHVDQQWSTMRGLWRWSTRLAIRFSAVIIVVGLIGLWMLGKRIPETKAMTLLVGFALVPLAALGALQGSALRGLGRIVLGQLCERALRPGIFILLILVAIGAWPRRALSPTHAMALHALAAAAAYAIGALLLGRFQPLPAKDPVYMPRQWIRAAAPLGLIASLQVVNSQADILMLGLLRADAEVGIYRVVIQAAQLVVFGLQAMNLMLMPYFAKLHAQKDLQRLQRLATQSSRAILFLAMPVAFAFIAFGDSILGLVFGEVYRAGHASLAILAVGQTINAAMGSAAILMNMTGNERITLHVLGVAAAANIILNGLLIPVYGLEGAAMATAATIALWKVVLRRLVRRRIGLESMAYNPFARWRSR